MESGVVARVAAGLGAIDAQAAPTPVSFDAKKFSTVVKGDRVNFTRNTQYSDMADWVGLAAPAKAFLSLVQPTSLRSLWLNACQLNESGPDGWYKLSNAGMAGCGLSFGVNQFDLLTNEQAAPALVRVLKAAKAAQPTIAITSGQIDAIAAGGLKVSAADARPGTAAGDLISPVNEALATVVGRAALTQEGNTALDADITFLRTWQAKLTDTVGGEDLVGSNLAVQLLCLDFFNLFGRPTKLTTYLNGGAVTLNGGQAVAPVAGPASLSDMLRYILATKQGMGAGRGERDEVLRRMNNVLHLARPLIGWPEWSDKDRAWFETDLAAALAAKTGPVAVARGQHLYGELLSLIG